MIAKGFLLYRLFFFFREYCFRMFVNWPGRLVKGLGASREHGEARWAEQSEGEEVSLVF